MLKKILVIDDEERLRDLYSDILTKRGFDIITAESAEAAISVMESLIPDMIISDIKMSGMNGIEFLKQVKKEYPNIPFLLITAYADIKDAITALKLGAVDYLEKPVDLDELIAAVSDTLNIKTEENQNKIPKKLQENIIIENSICKTIFNDAYNVSKSDVNILITGESGTGKEVIAQFIHNSSDRNNNIFFAINCASIPHNLLASELFGHVKGAFTGANSDRNGAFRESQGGTLFLDEIGDMPLELQSTLLRAIEQRVISPLGSDKNIKVDFRLIAATNKNLLEEVEAGRFREDLYYRLNVISFEMPPLRNRKEEIIPLAKYFLSTKSVNKKISVTTVNLMQSYLWPGNIRELANAMERASLLSHSDMILPEHLPAKIAKHNISNSATIANETNLQTISQAERETIEKALKHTQGNRTKAAELIGISRRSIINKIKIFDL